MISDIVQSWPTAVTVVIEQFVVCYGGAILARRASVRGSHGLRASSNDVSSLRRFSETSTISDLRILCLSFLRDSYSEWLAPLRLAYFWPAPVAAGAATERVAAVLECGVITKF